MEINFYENIMILVLLSRSALIKTNNFILSQKLCAFSNRISQDFLKNPLQ